MPRWLGHQSGGADLKPFFQQPVELLWTDTKIPVWGFILIVAIVLIVIVMVVFKGKMIPDLRAMVTRKEASEVTKEAYASGLLREKMSFTDAASPRNTAQIGNVSVEAATPEPPVTAQTDYNTLTGMMG
jgi:hypothetical protein